MSKLRGQIILFIDLFLVLFLGGALLFYSLFAEDHYLLRKKRQINEAFAFIRSLDLNNLGNEDEEAFLPLEGSFSVINICDSDFQLVYASGSQSGNSIVPDRIRKQAALYTEDASAVYYPEENGKPVTLHGLIRQDQHLFYVLIYENTRVLHGGIRYTRQVLGDLLLLAIFLGTLFALLLSEWITRPLARIRQLIQRMMQNDFSRRLPEQCRFNELG